MEACSICQASVSAALWAGHQQRFHASADARWKCGGCAYAGVSLADAFCHALLQGHCLAQREKTSAEWLPVALPPSADQEPPIRSPSLPATPTPSEPTFSLPATPTPSEPTYSDKYFSQGVKEMDLSLPVEEREKISLPARVEESTKEKGSLLESQDPASNTSDKAITCQRCQKQLSCYHSRDLFKIALAHAKACLRIRPYACSACGYLSSLKKDVARHGRVRCPGASVLLLDRENHDSQIRTGLQTCFPHRNIPFRGLCQ